MLSWSKRNRMQKGYFDIIEKARLQVVSTVRSNSIPVSQDVLKQ